MFSARYMGGRLRNWSLDNTVCKYIYFFLLLLWRDSPQWARASSFTRFLDHTQRRTTVSRTPLNEWSARRKDLYLTTHNTQQQTDNHAPGGNRTHDLSRRAAVDLRLRPRGHWDRRIYIYIYIYIHLHTTKKNLVLTSFTFCKIWLKEYVLVLLIWCYTVGNTKLLMLALLFTSI
jgi:hypothetical protein